MKIAVTGGSGFIGQYVMERAAADGHRAWAFDRSDGHDVLEDLSGLRGEDGNPDAVIHLAGILGTSELFDVAEQALKINVIGSQRVIEWCRDHGARYVGISMHSRFPSIYNATKVASREVATAYHVAFGLPVSHVRAYNAYGPGQAYGTGHPQKILPTFARLAWEGKPIPVWGDGEQSVDLVHAQDVARMLLDACYFGGNNEVFDAGTGVPVTVNEVARFVLEITGSTAGIEYLPMRIGEKPAEIKADGLGWSSLGWKPELDWDKVADTVRWYKP
jgi:UDP-glucose 4-epimerase